MSVSIEEGIKPVYFRCDGRECLIRISIKEGTRIDADTIYHEKCKVCYPKPPGEWFNIARREYNGSSEYHFRSFVNAFRDNGYEEL